MHINKTSLLNCYEINPVVSKDIRGKFVKTYHEDTFIKNGLETNFVEDYYTCSHQRVLRGLHFQTPPKHCTKLVYCTLGEVFDVVVDLRVGSPTYGMFETFKLSAEKANMIYIPPGMAHGFYVMSKSAILVYKVSSMYSPENDTGIMWNSVDIQWPDPNPIISERDEQFSSLSHFKNPFIYKENTAYE